MNIVTVVDNRIYKIFRRIKTTFSFDAHEPHQLAPFGDDSVPYNGVKGLKVPTSTDSIHAILGYFNRDPKALSGEKRLYATDSEGNFVCSIWMKNDGTIEFNNTSDENTPNNYMVKYNELETQFNQLKSDFGTLLSKYNSHTHILTLTSGTGTAATTTNTTTANSADITQCKNINLKTT